MNPTSMICTDSEFKYVTFDDSFKYPDYKQAAHCVIYCIHSQMVINKTYDTKAAVSMQVRFDGQLGFPGGRISRDEYRDIVGGLNRELVEEINLVPELFMSNADYLYSHQHDKSKQFLHFYAKEVSLEQFLSMEENTLKAEEFGDETMGFFRVPLFTMKDGYRGLPAFLDNNFIGNAKDQLLNFLIHSHILTTDEVKDALKKSKFKVCY